MPSGDGRIHIDRPAARCTRLAVLRARAGPLCARHRRVQVRGILQKGARERVRKYGHPAVFAAVPAVGGGGGGGGGVRLDGTSAHGLTFLLYAYNIYSCGMRFSYDPAKEAANVKKHGVSFSDAEGVFEDSLAATVEDPDAEGEQRFVAAGLGSAGQLLVDRKNAHLNIHRQRGARRVSCASVEDRIRVSNHDERGSSGVSVPSRPARYRESAAPNSAPGDARVRARFKRWNNETRPQEGGALAESRL